MSQNHNGNKGSRPLAEQLKAALKPEEQKPQVIASNEEEGEDEDDVAVGQNVEVEIEETDEVESDAVNEGDDAGDEEEDEVAMADEASESDDEEEAEEAADEEEESVFSTQPFAGLINQSITVVVGLGDAKDSHNFNFQNPFSKKAGVAREFIAGIVPLMQDLAQREVLVLTDNFNQSVSAILGVLSNNSVKQLETMFGGTEAKQLGFPVTMSVRDMVAVDSDYPSMAIDTTLTINMPSLTDAKNDVVIRNLFIYLDKLKEELGNIGLRVIIGFQTEELIKADSRSAFDELKERADAGELKLVVRSNSEALNDYGFDETQIYNLFEDFDVVFVKA